jgi:hypothetical protein
MGILMWVGEKYEELASPENQTKASWTESILTTASLYYFSGCIMPSMLPYKENLRHHDFAKVASLPENYIRVPFGFTSYLFDSQPASKRSVERTGNLKYYKGTYGINAKEKTYLIFHSLMGKFAQNATTQDILLLSKTPLESFMTCENSPARNGTWKNKKFQRYGNAK